MKSLLELTAQNSSFSKATPGLQLAWDSVSLGELKTCPYKYFLTIIMSWQAKRSAPPLEFGILYHKGMEIYEHRVAGGTEHLAAIETTVKEILIQAKDFAPDDDPLRTKKFLIRAIVWKLDIFGKNDPAKTVILENGKPAVELSFRHSLNLESDSREEFYLCGHIDRMVNFDDKVYATDHKTTKSTLSSYYFNNFSPDNQISLYTYSGNVIHKEPIQGVMIDAAQLAVSFVRFGRGFAPRTPEQITEWIDDTHEWVKLAERFATRESWPMNDKACGMYGGCKFRNVCSKSPSVRETFLEADFKKKVWDPLLIRGNDV